MAGTREFESPEIEPDGAPKNGAPQNGSPRAASAKSVRRAWGAVTGWAGGAVREMSLPEEDLPNGPIEGFVASTPPWLISLVIHIGIVMGLGLIVLEAQPRHDRSIEVDISGLDANDTGDGLPVGEQLTDPTQTVSTQGHDDVSESATGAAACGDSRCDDSAAWPVCRRWIFRRTGCCRWRPSKDRRSDLRSRAASQG